MSRLHIVTATTDQLRSAAAMDSWIKYAAGAPKLHVVDNGQRGDYLGVVPAFALGIQQALDDGAEVIAAFHDDLTLLPGAENWDARVLGCFDERPRLGLAGFGGGTGLGSADIYASKYDPNQLARRNFVSNMDDAEAHGSRSRDVVKVACLDGFSQIGRRDFWLGRPYAKLSQRVVTGNLLTLLATLGCIHHAYDSALGAFAKRLEYDVWMIPIPCHHAGGQTAVGDAWYQAWAQEQIEGGDQGFWTRSHKIVYDLFRDVLPFDVDPRR